METLDLWLGYSRTRRTAGAAVNMNNQNVSLGVSLLSVGVALLIVLDSWIIGLVFLLIGGQRLFVGLQESKDDND